MSTKLLVQRKNRVCFLTLNRPEVRNAVDTETMSRIRAEIEISEKDGTRVVVLSGSGGAFSSGADIKAALQNKLSPDEAYEVLLKTYTPTLLSIWNSSLPIVAAIDGVAAGIGLNMALACDLRLASQNAKFSEIFIHVGLIPDGGGTFTLPRLVGMGRAMEMVLTGNTVDAAEALEMGLVNRVYPEEEFESKVAQFAEFLAGQAPMALSRAKKAIHAALEGTFESALAQEAVHQKAIFQSEDGFEGFRAFLEKRRPKWKNP